MGLEPTRHCCHKILSLARLPVPTLPHNCVPHSFLSILKIRRFVKDYFRSFVIEKNEKLLYDKTDVIL